MARKILFWILLSIGLVLVFGVILIIYKTVKNNNNFMKYAKIDQIRISDSVNKSYTKDLRLPASYLIDNTVISKTRQPIEVFSIDNSTACFIYQMPVNSSAPLTQILSVQHKSILPNFGGYWGIPFPGFLGNCDYQIRYEQGPPIEGDRIVFTTDSPNLKLTEKSDTLYQYIGRFKTFNLSYRASGTLDFRGEVKPKDSHEAKHHYINASPMGVTFKKVNDHYYLLLYVAK